MNDEVKQKPLLTLNNKDYFEADFNEESINLLNMTKFVVTQINDLNNKLVVAQDHKQKLIADLGQALNGGSEETTIIETETKEEKNGI
jgi:hypothetical protein|tara:strand:+ start:817 stop:1080 length:264 start_codon:yes stop_codon:yes gene_type:complete